MTVESLIQILQASIGPVVLISGVGLLLLSLTNRLGRSLDRIRLFCTEIKKGAADDAFLKDQVRILYRRCKILRLSIVFAIISVVCVSVIIFTLFSIYIFHINFIVLVEWLFSAALVSLIVCLLFFLQDIFVTLASVKIEIDRTIGR